MINAGLCSRIEIMQIQKEQKASISPEVLFQEVSGETVLLDLASENYFGWMSSVRASGAYLSRAPVWATCWMCWWMSTRWKGMYWKKT